VNRSHSPAHFDAPGDEGHQRILDALHDHGWSEQDNFLPPDLTLSLALECAALAAAGTLTLARVSQGAARSLRPDVRGDQIHWLEAGQSEACDRYLAIMEMLRIALNRGCVWDLKNTKATLRSTRRALHICDTAISFATTIAARCPSSSI
jgi:SM-20-related protein